MVLVIIGTSLKLDAVLMDDLHPGSVITAFALNKASTIYYWVDDILLNFSSSIEKKKRHSFEFRSTGIITLLKVVMYLAS